MSTNKLYTFWLSGKPVLWSTYAVAALPILPNNFSSTTMMAWCAVLLLHNFIQSKQPVAKKTSHRKYFFILGGNFILFALSLLYTQDMKEGISFLQVCLPMLLFPFLTFFVPHTIPADEQFMNVVHRVFWSSTVALTLFLFYKFLQLGYLQQFSTVDSFSGIYRESSEAFTNKHPMYLSLFLAFSVYIAAVQFQKSKKLFIKLLYLLSIPLLVSMLLLLASRGPLIGMAVGFVMVFFAAIKNIRTRIIAVTGFIGLFLLLVRLTPAIYSRVQEFKDTPLETPVGVHHNSVNIRVGIYKCTWQLIRNNLLLGIGAGDDKKALTECYTQFPTDAYTIRFYNTHNQYANFFLLTGVFSLLLFLYGIVVIYKVAFVKKYYTLLFFITLMVISFLTENILSRQAGIVFYYYFTCLLFYQALSYKKNNAGNSIAAAVVNTGESKSIN